MWGLAAMGAGRDQRSVLRKMMPQLSFKRRVDVRVSGSGMENSRWKKTLEKVKKHRGSDRGARRGCLESWAASV